MRCGPKYPSNRHACIKPPLRAFPLIPDNPLSPDNPPPPDNPLSPGIPPPSKKAAISPLNTGKHFKQLGAMALGGNEHIDASRQFAGVAG